MAETEKRPEKYHEYPLMIREGHLDTFGHINNAVYLQIFEEARWDLITQRGFGLKQVHETQTGPTILSFDIQFKKEIKNREHVVIKTGLLSYEGKIGKLLQIIVNEKGEECCTSVMTFGLFDMKQRKLILPHEAWRKAIEV